MSARFYVTIGLTIAAVAFGGWRMLIPGSDSRFLGCLERGHLAHLDDASGVVHRGAGEPRCATCRNRHLRRHGGSASAHARSRRRDLVLPAAREGRSAPAPRRAWRYPGARPLLTARPGDRFRRCSNCARTASAVIATCHRTATSPASARSSARSVPTAPRPRSAAAARTAAATSHGGPFGRPRAREASGVDPASARAAPRVRTRRWLIERRQSQKPA